MTPVGPATATPERVTTITGPRTTDAREAVAVVAAPVEASPAGAAAAVAAVVVVAVVVVVAAEAAAAIDAGNRTEAVPVERSDHRIHAGTKTRWPVLAAHEVRDEKVTAWPDHFQPARESGGPRLGGTAAGLTTRNSG